MNNNDDDFRQLHSDIVALRVEMSGLNATLSNVVKIVRDGNGHPAGALITRVALLERAVLGLESQESRKNIRQWQVVMSLVAAGLSLAVAITSAFLGFNHT